MMTKSCILGLMLFSLPHVGMAKDVFDVHVHLWNGDKSVQEYLSHLDRSNQNVTRFGGIFMARKGEVARNREKNDELIALSRQYPKLVVLLGSDFPQFSLAQSVEALERLDLDEVEKDKIRNGNAKKLFFPDKG